MTFSHDHKLYALLLERARHERARTDQAQAEAEGIGFQEVLNRAFDAGTLWACIRVLEGAAVEGSSLTAIATLIEAVAAINDEIEEAKLCLDQ